MAVGKITWWDNLNQHCGCPPLLGHPLGLCSQTKRPDPESRSQAISAYKKHQAGLDSHCAKSSRWKNCGSLKKGSPSPNRCGNFQRWIRRPWVGQPFASPTAESLRCHTLPTDGSASLPLPFPNRTRPQTSHFSPKRDFLWALRQPEVVTRYPLWLQHSPAVGNLDGDRDLPRGDHPSKRISNTPVPELNNQRGL